MTFSAVSYMFAITPPVFAVFSAETCTFRSNRAALAPCRVSAPNTSCLLAKAAAQIVLIAIILFTFLIPPLPLRSHPRIAHILKGLASSILEAPSQGPRSPSKRLPNGPKTLPK